MTELQKVIRNYPSLQKEVMTLENLGLVVRKEERERQRVVYVLLTEKGLAVAEKLKEAEEIATGKIEMHPDWREKFKNMRAMLHFNLYENTIRISEYLPDGSERVVDVDITVNGNKMYLYCSACGSFNCEHINFIWSHPKLRRALLEKAQEKHLIIVEPEKAEKEINGNGGF